MSDIQIHIESTDIQKGMKELQKIPSKIPVALSRSMNRAVAGMKTTAGRAVPKAYFVKNSEIKSKIAVMKASASQSEISAEIRSKGRPIRSIKFKYKPNVSPGKKSGRGVFLRVKKAGSGGEVLKNGNKAFLATMKNGTRGIFARKSSKRSIEQIHAPSVTEMLNNPAIKDEIMKDGKERFTKEFDRQAKLLLKG